MSSHLPSLKLDVNLSLSLSSIAASIDGTIDDVLKSENNGVRLIKLLLTCASHASSGDFHRADACLRKISQFTSVTNDSMHRLATWFASALAVRLVKCWPGVYKALNCSSPMKFDFDRARSIFTKVLPYMGFAYSVINRTLIQAISGEQVVHLVDLGSGDPELWVPFMRILATSPNGPPHLRITCVCNNKIALDKLGACLKKEAEQLDMPFQFNPVNVHLHQDLNFDSIIKVRSGEALAFISILNLHVLLAEDDRIDSQFKLNKDFKNIKHCKHADEFLSNLCSLSPKLVMLVEQESNHNLQKLVDRFVEGLRYYSAMFDSIDVAFKGGLCEERLLVEEMIGKEIENIVACDGLEREERHEKFGNWMVRLGRAKFRQVRLWGDTMDDAIKFVEAYGGDGYKISSQRGSLMICWHDRPIYSVSGWTCFN